jgi:sugar transferase (PEP-CTERM system associated)
MHVRVSRHFVPFPTVLLATLDLWFVIVILAWVDIASVRDLIIPTTGPISVASLTLSFWPVALVSTISAGLYSGEVIADYGVLVRVGIACGFTLAFAVVTSPYAHAESAAPSHAGNLPFAAALGWFTWVALSRTAFATAFELGLLKRRILVLGVGKQASRIAELVDSARNRHFLPVSYIALPGERAYLRRDTRHAEELSSLPALASDLGFTEIVVATGERRGLPVQQLLHCKLSGIRVTEFLDFWERETRTVDLEALRPSWLFYSDGFRCGALDVTLKRAFDIAASLGLLLLTLPVQLLTACLIRLDSSGPVFYRQERVGRNGRIFTMFKFRSMHVDAERDGRPRWAGERDPRMTRVGRIIRKLRIDELPQAINVLRGDMSFVGPRPERPFFVEQLSQAIPYYAERHCVRPGITGWAQVNFDYGASVEDARKKLSYDLYYVKNRSIFLDFIILLQTVRVIFRSGAR